MLQRDYSPADTLNYYSIRFKLLVKEKYLKNLQQNKLDIEVGDLKERSKTFS